MTERRGGKSRLVYDKATRSIRAEGPKEDWRAERTRIYDTLAAINDAIEVGDDGVARFASLNDRDRFREVVQELEDDALAYRGECSKQEAGD